MQNRAKQYNECLALLRLIICYARIYLFMLSQWKGLTRKLIYSSYLNNVTAQILPTQGLCFSFTSTAAQLQGFMAFGHEDLF